MTEWDFKRLETARGFCARILDLFLRGRVEESSVIGAFNAVVDKLASLPEDARSLDVLDEFERFLRRVSAAFVDGVWHVFCRRIMQLVLWPRAHEDDDDVGLLALAHVEHYLGDAHDVERFFRLLYRGQFKQLARWLAHLDPAVPHSHRAEWGQQCSKALAAVTSPMDNVGAHIFGISQSCSNEFPIMAAKLAEAYKYDTVSDLRAFLQEERARFKGRPASACAEDVRAGLLEAEKYACEASEGHVDRLRYPPYKMKDQDFRAYSSSQTPACAEWRALAGNASESKQTKETKKPKDDSWEGWPLGWVFR
jgi:hypothetical protein